MNTLINTWNFPNPDLTKPVLISQGDPHGIGPEVLLKCAKIKLPYPVVIIGSEEVFKFYQYSITGSEELPFPVLYFHTKDKKLENGFHLFPLPYRVPIIPGKTSIESGSFAFDCIQKALSWIRDDFSQVLVTAPVNKKAISLTHPLFSGHTEYIAEFFGLKPNDVTMSFLSEEMRLFLVTTHVPIQQLPYVFNKDVLLRTMIHAHKTVTHLGDSRPLALMALNPHAGEEGLLGNEEKEIMVPMMEEAKSRGIAIEGPFPNDAFWKGFNNLGYSGYIAPSHDMGLIPAKMIGQNKLINTTLGLSFLRVSVDHGTGMDIAGKNLAKPNNMHYILEELTKLLK